MPVGIDLFVGRCIEGVQLATAAAPVTYPPQLTWRQPPKRLGVGACSGFGRSRSERVFRNEFPYLGRVGLAAWADFRPVGSGGTAARAICSRRTSAGAGPGTRSCASAEGQGRAEGCTESPSRGARPDHPAG